MSARCRVTLIPLTGSYAHHEDNRPCAQAGQTARLRQQVLLHRLALGRLPTVGLARAEYLVETRTNGVFGGHAN